MSIQPVPNLQAVVSERGPHAYVVTVSEHGAPHAVYAPVRWERGGLVAEVGAHTAANAATRPQVSLLYPVRVDGDYSLIVDGAESRDAAWYYPDPKPAAAEIKDRIAFWRGVEVG
jgi:hypothetical protein